MLICRDVFRGVGKGVPGANILGAVNFGNHFDIFRIWLVKKKNYYTLK